MKYKVKLQTEYSFVQSSRFVLWRVEIDILRNCKRKHPEITMLKPKSGLGDRSESVECLVIERFPFTLIEPGWNVFLDRCRKRTLVTINVHLSTEVSKLIYTHTGWQTMKFIFWNANARFSAFKSVSYTCIKCFRNCSRQTILMNSRHSIAPEFEIPMKIFSRERNFLDSLFPL